MQISEEQMQQIAEKLLQNEKFLKSLGDFNAKSSSFSSIELDSLIKEISELLDLLIHQKLQKEMCDLIDDNNRILQQIGANLMKQNNSLEDKNFSNQHDASFSDIHKLINEEKKKAIQGMNDAETERSLSVMEKYEEKYGDVNEKILHLQHKIRAMEEKYESGFKSLWNVMSMTQSAFFDHIKEYKQNKDRENSVDSSTKGSQKNSSIFGFWK